MRHSKPQSHLQHGLTQGRALAIYRTLRWMVLATVLGLAWLIQAQADVTQGLAWLQSQLQSNGQLSTPSAVGTTDQTRCEVADTLLQMAGNSPPVNALISAIQSGPDKA